MRRAQSRRPRSGRTLRMTRPSRALWRLLAVMLALVLVAAACGGDDDDDSGSSSDTTAEGGGDLSGTIAIDGSSTVAPLSETAAEDFMAENSGCADHRRHLRHRWWVREVLQRRDRHQRRVAADQGGRRGGGTELRGQRHRVHRAPGRQRRTDDRREYRERLGRVPHGRAAQDDLGAGGRGHGHELEPGRPLVPGRSARGFRSRH